jgi:hypothetical protein
VKKVIAVFCFILVSSCGCSRSDGDRGSADRSGISKEIEMQIQQNNWERIDLATVGGAAWQRVCVLGPYSDNSRVEEILGFKWDLAQKAPAVVNADGVNVLVFVEGKDVIAHAEHPRDRGDFAQLSGECFDRAAATFVKDQTNKDKGRTSFVRAK